jgi:hypothetical protein
MSKRLEVPDELKHLIEKRVSDEDRRRRDDRAVGERRQEDLGPLGTIESAANLDDVPTEERRTNVERRKDGNSRRKNRRRNDT